MSFTWAPSSFYRYSLALTKPDHMKGTDVAALQLNLPKVTVDGDFGDKTDAAVRNFQVKHSLFVDGIAGPTTQGKIVTTRSSAASTKYSLPTGLLRSLATNESGLILGAFSQHPSDWGYDIGAYQLSIGPSGLDPTQANFQFGYDVDRMAEYVASNTSVKHNSFQNAVSSQYLSDLADGNQDKFAWQLAINDHNWPFASANIHDHGHIYANPAQDDEPADWVISASGGHLSTPRQWVYSYVQKATVYVRW
jgi:hypothetical protein